MKNGPTSNSRIFWYLYEPMVGSICLFYTTVLLYDPKDEPIFKLLLVVYVFTNWVDHIPSSKLVTSKVEPYEARCALTWSTVHKILFGYCPHTILNSTIWHHITPSRCNANSPLHIKYYGSVATTTAQRQNSSGLLPQCLYKSHRQGKILNSVLKCFVKGVMDFKNTIWFEERPKSNVLLLFFILRKSLFYDTLSNKPNLFSLLPTVLS